VALEIDKPQGQDFLPSLFEEPTALGVKVSGLSFTYPGGTEVLKDLSFSVLAGSRVLLAGATGSGKSTLLRCLKPELTPHGRLVGELAVDGLAIGDFNPQLSAGRIGFVMQDPHQQIVMDTVKAELAFGLENLGTPPESIQRRIAEIANYFGIHSWVDRSTSDLSGGEKQLVNLAAIIAMQPRTLLLDEPTVGLDPIAAREFLELVQRVNDELGITVILVEHHQEDVLSHMNQVLYLEEGKLAFDGSPRSFALWLHESDRAQVRGLPVASRLYFNSLDQTTEVRDITEIPLGVREGRWWLWQHAASAPEIPKLSTPSPCQSVVVEVKHVWFRYGKEDPYVLKDLSLKIESGSLLGIVGANASGKSTLLSLLFGAYKPQHGKIRQAHGARLALLPQDPTTLFIHDSLQDELMAHSRNFDYGEVEVQAMLERMGLSNKARRHPFDLSGGEQQKLALAKLLLTKPSILLLDEPTKGLDSLALDDLGKILRSFVDEGKTALIVSHDLEFVAATADECLMLFDGTSVGRGPVKEFFTGNMFYTTALQRITQGILDDCPPVLPTTRGTTRGDRSRGSSQMTHGTCPLGSSVPLSSHVLLVDDEADS